MAQCKSNFQFLQNLEYECFVSTRKITARGLKIIYKYIKNRLKRFHVTSSNNICVMKNSSHLVAVILNLVSKTSLYRSQN